jgi:hypothetical protein
MKENWLMVVLVLVVILFLSGGNVIVGDSFGNAKNLGQSFDRSVNEIGLTAYYPDSSDGFAPEIEERKITRSSSLSTEIERGEFGEAEIKLKNIIISSGAYLLNERVNKNGEGWRASFYGYYSLKVETDKYDAVVVQLKEIGEVQSFNENMADVTERYDDVEIELSAERERLDRYLKMYDDAEEVGDQIELNDRIFNQERTIKYLEESLENIDSRIDYSTISFSMNEERSGYGSIAFVKLGDLARSFVDNLNTLLNLIFGLIPWAVALLVGLFFWKRFRKS